MDNDKLIKIINQTIDIKLASMSNLAIGNHAHNGYDVNQLDPAVALLGFPVIQVDNASINPITRNPNDKPQNGTFRFYVDTLPRYILWSYLTYVDSTGQLVGTWRYLNLLRLP